MLVCKAKYFESELRQFVRHLGQLRAVKVIVPQLVPKSVHIALMPLLVQQDPISLLLQQLWMRAFAREALRVLLQSDARVLCEVRVKQNVKAFPDHQRV